MEKKKFQSVSIAALIVSILPLVALAPSLLHLSLSDGVRTAWAGANVVFVLLGLILSVVSSAADTGNCENMVTAPSPRASRAAVILFFFIIMVYNTPVYKNVEK